MKNYTFQNKIVSRDQMADCAKGLVSLPVRIWTLTGTLGAGKTTLVQEILTQLGVVGPIQSPTYTYVTLYQLADGRTVYHFDLYRLSSYEQFVQAGFDEYLYDENGICFIEWPEIVLPYLPAPAGHIVLDYAPDGQKRLISIS